MKDSLLTEKQKKKILKAIKQKKYNSIISILEKIKTTHAGTAKTKDKRFVIREIIKDVIDNSKNPEKDFFNIGSLFCNMKQDVSKEIGISLVWRGYEFNPMSVKEFLLKIADDANWEVREYAASAFADTLYNNGDFYDDVIEWTKHHSENVRRAVVFSALGLREK
ncbi:MAG: HEAT repeat domain-containing protein, partial [bacterium]